MSGRREDPPFGPDAEIDSEIPAGVDRRTFLMKTAVLGSAAVIAGRPVTAEDDRFMQLKGVAAARAHTWVQSLLRRRVDRRAVWDPEKALAIARTKVADPARPEAQGTARGCDAQSIRSPSPSRTRDPAVWLHGSSDPWVSRACGIVLSG